MSKDIANQFFNDIIKNAQDMYVARMGKIVNFYPETQKVDVMPWPSEDNAIILNVPVSTLRTKDFLMYYPFEPDDMVVLLFADNDTEDIKLGVDKAQTERGHAITDCIALGGFTRLNETLEVDYPEEMVIQNLKNEVALTVKKDGDLDIKYKNLKEHTLENTAEINVSENGNINVTCKDVTVVSQTALVKGQDVDVVGNNVVVQGVSTDVLGAPITIGPAVNITGTCTYNGRELACAGDRVTENGDIIKTQTAPTNTTCTGSKSSGGACSGAKSGKCSGFNKDGTKCDGIKEKCTGFDEHGEVCNGIKDLEGKCTGYDENWEHCNGVKNTVQG